MNNPSRASVLLAALLALGWIAGAWSREVCTQPGSATEPCMWFELEADSDSISSWPRESWQGWRVPFDAADLPVGAGPLGIQLPPIVNAPLHITPPAAATEPLLSLLRAEIAAAVADDDADAVAMIEAAVQAIKRRHPGSRRAAPE